MLHGMFEIEVMVVVWIDVRFSVIDNLMGSQKQVLSKHHFLLDMLLQFS